MRADGAKILCDVLVKNRGVTSIDLSSEYLLRGSDYPSSVRQTHPRLRR